MIFKGENYQSNRVYL